jgi:hypothetical protein
VRLPAVPNADDIDEAAGRADEPHNESSASSGLRSAASADSYAMRRTAASRRLIVAGA